jgi:hypothetical protein
MGSREVVSDEIATKAVFEKFDPDQRKQENGKEELVKAAAAADRAQVHRALQHDAPLLRLLPQ